MPYWAISLAGVVGAPLPPCFRITRTIEQNFNVHFLKFFWQKYKEPCRLLSPFTFSCVHGGPVAHDTRTFARYVFDIDTPPLSLFCCLLLFRKRRSSRAFWSSFNLNYPHLVCLFVCFPICCTQNTFKTMHNPQSPHDYHCNQM